VLSDLNPSASSIAFSTKMSRMSPFFIIFALFGLFPGNIKTDFRCPEEFGYYQHPEDCSLYYVCVFGGPLLESCTGGLVYSHDLQTCDWPRNVACKTNNVIDDTLELAIAIDSKKDQKQHSNRTPRKQSHDRKINLIMKKTSDEEVVNEEEEEELLALSPQPSIVSTVTHGATKKKNSIHSERSSKFRDPPPKITVHEKFDSKERVEIVEHRSITSLNFGDVLFGSRSNLRKEESQESDRSAKLLLNPINISHIEKSLIDSYPGVSKVLDDSEDNEPEDSFYYVNWEDPIYDQFDDYGDLLEEKKTKENEQEILDQKGSIHLTYHETPKRPSSQQTHGPQAEDIAKACSPRFCKLPDCRCGGTEPPGNFSAKRTPQLVVLTFDDSVNDLNKRLYKDIFHPSRKNPNGCPIAATFYVSHEWTDYGLVQSLYSDGHEIASHSISHSFGEQFSKKKWLKEMAGQREILAGFAGIKLEDVRGIRAPFLAIGGNNMFSMLYEANFTYDSSMPIYDNKPPSFPYTMDYKLSHDCMIPPCPNKAYPGVWELPLVMWNDLKEGRCSMADACSNPPTAEGVYYMIMKNFQRHYNTNRAPFGLSYHPAWFTTPHHKEGFELFLDTIVAMEDVWLVSAWQTVQWMRTPTPLDHIEDFKPFQCDYKERPPRCDKPKVCNLWHKSGVRYMRTCQECPDIYPWTGRTGIANSLVDPL